MGWSTEGRGEGRRGRVGRRKGRVVGEEKGNASEFLLSLLFRMVSGLQEFKLRLTLWLWFSHYLFFSLSSHR